MGAVAERGAVHMGDPCVVVHVVSVVIITIGVVSAVVDHSDEHIGIVTLCVAARLFVAIVVRIPGSRWCYDSGVLPSCAARWMSCEAKAIDCSMALALQKHARVASDVLFLAQRRSELVATALSSVQRSCASGMARPDLLPVVKPPSSFAEWCWGVRD